MAASSPNDQYFSQSVTRSPLSLGLSARGSLFILLDCVGVDKLVTLETKDIVKLRWGVSEEAFAADIVSIFEFIRFLFVELKNTSIVGPF